MKKSIETMLNSYVHDNKEFIRENGGNVAEYILRDTEAMDGGWLWFLSNEEVEEFEHDDGKRTAYIEEITQYVNENYNYEVEE